MPAETTTDAPWGARLEAPDWQGTARYEVLRCIGKGGMGVVYEAFDRERQQRVALKTLLNSSPAALYLFKQEFRTLADVHHRNLVHLYELVVGEDGRVFFTMELVRGTDFLTTSRGRRGRGRRATPLVGPRSTSRRVANSGPTAPRSGLERARRVPDDSPLRGVARRHRPPAPGALSARRRGARAALGRQAASRHQALERAGHARGPRRAPRLRRRHGARPRRRREPPRGRRDGRHRALHGARAGRERGARPPRRDWYSVGVMLYEALVGSRAVRRLGVRRAQDEEHARPAAPGRLRRGRPARPRRARAGAAAARRPSCARRARTSCTSSACGRAFGPCRRRRRSPTRPRRSSGREAPAARAPRGVRRRAHRALDHGPRRRPVGHGQVDRSSSTSSTSWSSAARRSSCAAGPTSASRSRTRRSTASSMR